MRLRVSDIVLHAPDRLAAYRDAGTTIDDPVHGEVIEIEAEQYEAIRQVAQAVAAAPEVVVTRREICLGCEYLGPEGIDGVRVCLHANCGCWRSEARKNPWEKLHACAASRW